MGRAYIRNKYNPSFRSWVNEQTFCLNNFAGGLNNVAPDNIIADNELTDTLNMRFLGDTLMESRPGTDISDFNLSLSSPITWIDEYYPTLSAKKKVVATSDAVYIDGKKIQDVKGNIRGVTYVGKYYFVDGHNLYVYDGTDCYKVVSDPIAYLSEETNTTQTKYKFYKLPEQLKSGDTVYILASVVGADVPFTTTISSIDRANNTVTFAKTVGKKLKVDDPVFFYTPDSGTVGEVIKDESKKIMYYKPCMAEIADEHAGASYFPDSPNIIVVHKDRLFVAGDSVQPHGVYMSSVEQPLYFPSGAGVSVKPNGEAIVDMVVFDDSLIIGRHNDMYVLYGDSEYSSLNSALDPFRIKQMDISSGFMCPSCGALLNNFYIFLGYDGRFYKLNTPTTFVEYLMTRPLDWKCDLFADPINLGKNTIQHMSSTAYNNEIWFSINDDLVVIYNYDNMAYTYYRGMQNRSLYTDGQRLLIGRTDGIVSGYCDVDVRYTDCGNPISYQLVTKRFDCNTSVNFKYFKNFIVTSYAYEDEQSEISMKVEIDFYNHPINEPINSNIAKFSKSRWGQVHFNNMTLYKSPYFNLDVRGRTIKFKFYSEGLTEDGHGKPFRLFDINTNYSYRDVR